MKLIMENYRRFIREATEYDEQFGRILDSDNPEQAIELAASLEIPAKDLPWTYVRFRRLAASRWSSMMYDEGAMGYDEMITKMMDEFGLSAGDYNELHKAAHPDKHLPAKDLSLRPGSGGGYE